MPVSASSVTQDLVPAIAGTLGRLRRSPGGSDAWVEAVIRAFERADPAAYDRLRRRVGLAQQLADLARLGPEERAKITLGLFFHELVGAAVPADTGKRSRTWTQYLLRNFDRLVPSFQISQALRSSTWEEIEAKEAAVAKLATVLDSEILEHSAKPLELIQTLQREALTLAAHEIVPLLLSEDGQQLCDYHFRLQGRSYTLDGSEIRESLQLLESDSVNTLSLSIPARSTPIATPSEPSNTDTVPVVPLDNFERRRRALRARTDLADRTDAQREDTAQQVTQSAIGRRLDATSIARITQMLREEEPAPTRLPAPDAPQEAERVRQPSSQPPQEEHMAIQPTSTTRSGPRQEANLAEKFSVLRSQLTQIQQVAANGQQLLDSLAPDLEELTTWMQEMETIVGRWKGPGRSEEDAA